MTTRKDKETEEMKRRLQNLSELHSDLGIERYNILLIGIIGSGKSSFYNTLATVFAGTVKAGAPARDALSSVTNQLYFYEIRSKDGKPLNLRIVDIRGFDEGRGYEHELRLILDGRLQARYVFPDEPKSIQEDQLSNATLNDEIHLVCFVTGTPSPDIFTETLRQRISEIQTTISKKGLPMVVVATKFDMLCPRIMGNADYVYKSDKAHNAVKTISSFFGIIEKHIFPVVNYLNEKEVECGKDRLALQALDAMVSLTQDFLENHQERTKKLDKWSERATKLHVPKRTQEKNEVLQRLEKELAEFEEKRLNVLCVGAAYGGKSSFIDSLASALRGKLYSKASCGYATGTCKRLAIEESTTEKMYQMKFKNKDGQMKTPHVYFGDTPGFQKSKGICLEDVKYVINGHVPNKYKIKNGIKKDPQISKKRQEQKDKVHCVCFVFDISTPPDEIPDNLKKTFHAIKDWLFRKQIPLLVILTKGDLNDTVKDCKILVYKNDVVKERMEKLKDMFGFKEHTIFPVINYTHEGDVEAEADTLLIAVFREILGIGKDYLDDYDDEDTDESDGAEA